MSVKLEYVKKSDSLYHVDDFISNPQWRRDSLFCPGCNSPVILKLGNQIAHHAAHRSASNCYGESAEHLNAKCRLEILLNQVNQLFVQRTCVKSRCGNKEKILFTEGWLRAEQEYQIGSYRADVALIFADTPPVAIEVFRSHALSDEKINWFNMAGVKWLEVGAYQANYWTAGKPLDWLRSSVSEWTCQACIIEPQVRRTVALWKCPLCRVRAYIGKANQDNNFSTRLIYWCTHPDPTKFIWLSLWEDSIDGETFCWRLEERAKTIAIALPRFGSNIDDLLNFSTPDSGYRWVPYTTRCEKYYIPDWSPQVHFLGLNSSNLQIIKLFKGASYESRIA